MCTVVCTRWDARDGILESSQTRVFVWFSTLIFPFYKMLFMKRLEYSCFVHFFVRIFFKPEKSLGFLWNPPVEGTVNSIDEKTLMSFVNLMSKNSISGQGEWRTGCGPGRASDLDRFTWIGTVWYGTFGLVGPGMKVLELIFKTLKSESFILIYKFDSDYGFYWLTYLNMKNLSESVETAVSGF